MRTPQKLLEAIILGIFCVTLKHVWLFFNIKYERVKIAVLEVLENSRKNISVIKFALSLHLY